MKDFGAPELDPAFVYLPAGSRWICEVSECYKHAFVATNTLLHIRLCITHADARASGHKLLFKDRIYRGILSRWNRIMFYHTKGKVIPLIQCDSCYLPLRSLVGCPMLKDEVWAKIGKARDTFCFDCVEKALGRELESSDLKDCVGNLGIMKIYEREIQRIHDDYAGRYRA